MKDEPSNNPVTQRENNFKQEDNFAKPDSQAGVASFNNSNSGFYGSGNAQPLSEANKSAIDALMNAGNQNMMSNNIHSEASDAQDSVRRDGSATNTGQIYIPPKDEGKMFVGGLNWETTDESLRNYFSKFGELIDCTVMRDSTTGRSRGFGFLTFADAKCVNAVIATDHFLDGRIIDPKRAIPREEQDKTAKIFVGGVGLDVNEDDFNQFFSKYGTVIDAQLMIDTKTGKPRGFGFITFDSHEAVDRIVSEPVLILKNKAIEVKRAEPRLKDANGNYINNSQSHNNNNNNSNNHNMNNFGNNNYNNNNGGNNQMNNRFNNPYGGYMGYNMNNGMNMMSGMGNMNMGMNAMTSMGGATMGQAQAGASGAEGSGAPGPGSMPNLQSMSPAMMMQYYSSWMQYFNQSEQMVMRQGGNNPNSAQQLQQVRHMRDMFVAHVKNMGFDPKTVGADSGNNENGSSDIGSAAEGQNQTAFNQSNTPTFDPREKPKIAQERENHRISQDNETGALRDRPRSFNNNNNNQSFNKGSAAITLLQGNEEDQGETNKNDGSFSNDKNEQGYDGVNDNNNDANNSNNKSGRDRYHRDSNKRHRSSHEDDEDDYDNDRSYHRSSRSGNGDKGHKSGRELSLGDRIREGTSDRKRRRGEDDKDVSSSSRHHRSSSRDRDHKSSRQGKANSRGSRRSKDSRRGGNNEDDRRDRDSKERQSKSPPLNAPTGPRGGSSSFRSGGKNYSRRYRSNHK